MCIFITYRNYFYIILFCKMVLYCLPEYIENDETIMKTMRIVKPKESQQVLKDGRLLGKGAINP